MNDKTILYVYGYGSNPETSSTMLNIKIVIEELGYNLVSIPYNQEDPNKGLDTLEKYIFDNKIKYVIGHSLGGFFTLCIDMDVKKLVINPCMFPSRELIKMNEYSEEILKRYKSLENWLYDDSLPVLTLENVIGLFGNKDELFSYYDYFSKIYKDAYYINAKHRPKIKSFTDSIKQKIKEFFN